MNLIKTIDLYGTPISLEDTVRKISLDCKYPVGSSYIQYPMSKSPRELWGDFSTWEEVYFSGSFLRTEGIFNEGTSDELKLEFLNGFKVEHYEYNPWDDYPNKKCLIATLDSSNPDLDKIKLNMRVFDKYNADGGWTVVRKIENNVIYCNSSPTLYGEYPTIYFGILYAMQSHKHGGDQMYHVNKASAQWADYVQDNTRDNQLKVTDDGTSGYCTTTDYNLNNTSNKLVRTHFVDDGETRSKNITIKVWRRIA